MATLGLQILFESGRELIIKVCNFQLICVSCMVLNHHLSTICQRIEIYLFFLNVEVERKRLALHSFFFCLFVILVL